MAKGSGMKSTTLKGGLTNKSPMAPSKKASGKNINSEAKRTGVAPTPKTLGPRYASVILDYLLGPRMRLA